MLRQTHGAPAAQIPTPNGRALAVPSRSGMCSATISLGPMSTLSARQAFILRTKSVGG